MSKETILKKFQESLTEKSNDIVAIVSDAIDEAVEEYKRDNEQSNDQWRKLALQFDGHRMQAIGMINHMLKELPEFAFPEVREFINQPPLPGEQVLADRISEIASIREDSINSAHDWVQGPYVTDTMGSGWCVRIDGTSIFDGLNKYGCKGRITFQIAAGLKSKEEAEQALANWLSIRKVKDAPTNETVRVCGVIADQIEDGSLFTSGIFSRKELAQKVRDVLTDYTHIKEDAGYYEFIANWCESISGPESIKLKNDQWAIIVDGPPPTNDELKDSLDEALLKAKEIIQKKYKFNV